MSDILQLCIVAVLAAYLGYRHWQREQSRFPETAWTEDSSEGEWTGHGMEVGRLSARVERVRQGYVAELKARPHADPRRKDLLATARRLVGHLPFFQRSEPRPDFGQEATPSPAAHQA